MIKVQPVNGFLKWSNALSIPLMLAVFGLLVAQWGGMASADDLGKEEEARKEADARLEKKLEKQVDTVVELQKVASSLESLLEDLKRRRDP